MNRIACVPLTAATRELSISAAQDRVHGSARCDELRLCGIVDEQCALEMRPQQSVNGVARKLVVSRHDEGFDHQMGLAKMADGLVVVAVGDLHGGLGLVPVG